MSKNWSWKGAGLSKDKTVACSESLKFFFFLSTLRMMIQISGKSAHFAQKCYFYQKPTNKHS